MRGCRNLTFDCMQKYASLSEFIFYFQPCSKILHDITISEPHYLLFFSADCQYIAAIRERLEMPHFSIVTKIYNSTYNSTVNA